MHIERVEASYVEKNFFRLKERNQINVDVSIRACMRVFFFKKSNKKKKKKNIKT